MRNKKTVLIIGGAGFVGSYLAEQLVEERYNVIVFDNLEAQVHYGKKPEYLTSQAEFIRGDVRDYEALAKVVERCDAVYQLAAAVGVQQSQYEIKRFIDVNISGTGNLLDILVNAKHHVKKVILMSSMTSYGEGTYKCPKCGPIKGGIRSEKQLKKNDWEMYCLNCGSAMHAIATSENTHLSGNSIYALTKKSQEEMSMLIGKTYRIPTVIFRGFNIYGPRQSISNPYTGVTAIFISRLKNNKKPVAYEDGKQTRDFVSVHDVVSALALALETPKADYQVMNLGSGTATPIENIALLLAKLMNKDTKPIISGNYRKNDLRNCFADISLAKQLLGWVPKVSLAEGMKELCEWANGERAMDLFEQAETELRQKKLLNHE